MTDTTRLLSDNVYDELLALIAAPDFVANSRLPGENELATKLRVSRPVLRQALTRLRAEGRIYSRKGSGNYVAEMRPQADIVEFGPLTDIADIRSFLEFRCNLEGEIAARAARLRSQAQLDEIIERRVEFERALTAGHGGIEQDIAFHTAIARASGNRFFLMTMTALVAQTRFSINLVRQLSERSLGERMQDVCKEHHAIEVALIASDPKAARLAMTAHLEGGMNRLFGK